MVALIALSAGLLAWLWPIGVGGRMLVGGDVTGFSIGLMAVLARAIREPRLPVWNDLWGYGFPGLAESQMGVYYPPHWLLYGLLGLEAAYTASLVLHTLWGGLGAYWAARRLGVSAAGGAIAGFAWATSGFFVIHLPHQWGYTVGSWMPWAWGLAWLSARGRGGRGAPWLLALVLALQVLPGHFQLAFATQVGVVLLILGGLEAGPRSRRGVGVVALATLSAFAMAALQLVPTYRLARLAAARRDFEYLSGFAATPLHLVSYVAPGLFRRSPLWRPLAWDPFHTSPEEYLAYVGLVPLFLAIGAVRHGLRREAAIRALALVAVGTTLLSLGPYLPGFGLLIRLPGFSFFRAPARWSAASGLALGLLAGFGFDAWRTWPRPGRILARFVALAALGPAIVVGGVELALASSERPGWPVVAAAFERALNLLPWSRVGGSGPGPAPDPFSEPRPPTFLELMARARQPQDDDHRVQAALARQGRPWRGAGRTTFSRTRRDIYRQELAPTAVVLLALLAAAALSRRRGLFEAALVVVTAADLGLVGRIRPFDYGPIRPLVAQSPVLGRLAREPRGTRTVDPSSNLPMVARAAPVGAYRTLDLPALTLLTALAGGDLGLPGSGAEVAEALRATGASVRVLTASEAVRASSVGTELPGWPDRMTVRDPALAGWLFGADWVAQQGTAASTFTVWQPGSSTSPAWLVPLTSSRPATILEGWSGRPGDVLEVLRPATPLPVRRPRPERLEVDVRVDGPAVVVVSQLADPQWRARWVGAGGERPAEVRPAFARPGEVGWQAVATPGPGPWTLQMDYDARDVRFGLGASALAWGVWAVSFALVARRATRSQEGVS